MERTKSAGLIERVSFWKGDPCLGRATAASWYKLVEERRELGGSSTAPGTLPLASSCTFQSTDN